ncbi:hypothetical protein BH20ACI3_BH20ACI3_08760 [soil metagenome]
MNNSLTSEEELITLVRSVANEVYDPCGLALGTSIGIADMGLIRSLSVERLENGWGVTLRLRFTSPGCFYFVYFEREIRDRLKGVRQIKSLNIEWDKVVDWTPEDISAAAQLKLKEYREKLLAANTTNFHRQV